MNLRGKLTTKQAAGRLGVHISALRRMVYAGKLKEIKLSARVILYSEAEVSKLIVDRKTWRKGRPRSKQ